MRSARIDHRYHGHGSTKSARSKCRRTLGPIRDALMDYAWLGDDEKQREEVECILSHPGVGPEVEVLMDRALEAQYQREASTGEGDHPDADAALTEAVSMLYETHDSSTCEYGEARDDG